MPHLKNVFKHSTYIKRLLLVVSQLLKYLASPVYLMICFFMSQAPIFSGMYFKTPIILLITSAAVAALWLTTILGRTNKRNIQLKIKKKHGKLNAITEDSHLKIFFSFLYLLVLFSK